MANTLWVRHNASWQTKYMHLSDCGMAPTPALLRAGDQIGWSGKTGANAIHLHFELRGDGDNFTSFPADPNHLHGNNDCCQYGNCYWSYPVPELGLAIPPSLKSGQDPCPADLTCLSPRPAVVPGGMWVTPKAGASISSAPLHIEARAYRSAPRDPAIAMVNFIAWWPELGPNDKPWISLCAPHAPDHDDVYACDVDLGAIAVPPGVLTISFDVYDHAGNRNRAPNGTHEIVWSPDAGCPDSRLNCQGQRVDPKTNGAHCGHCDHGCGIVSICCDGVCVCDTTSIIPFYCITATMLCVNGEPQPA